MGERTFGRRAILTGAAGAMALLAIRPAGAVLVAADDTRLTTATVTFPGASGELSGYLVRPAGIETRLPAVIVVHESRGLTAHVEDVARRIGLAGFMALAPDLLSTSGGTPPDTAEGRKAVSSLPTDPLVADLVAAMVYLRLRPDCGDRIGAMGFGWGASLVGRFAAAAPALAAGVIYYGRLPPPGDAERIRTPLLVHQAVMDAKTNEGTEAFQVAMATARTRLTVQRYEGADQGFFNDTARGRYSGQAAEDSWAQTVAFLKETLG